MEHAEESTKNLTTGIQLLLKSNLNMSRRLRKIERMHPAMAASTSASKASSTFELNMLLGENLTSTDSNVLHFEEALVTSPAYKRAGFNRLRISGSSSVISPGPSFLSGLSLQDVDNVSAVALPISSRELWNHHRYPGAQTADLKTSSQALDAWYNPPSMVGFADPKFQISSSAHGSNQKSAFIRTAYFNGQYTNQYAQPKFTGHLIYRRFSVGRTPHSSPVFKEGAALPQIIESPSMNEATCKGPTSDNIAELEDTAGRDHLAADLTNACKADIPAASNELRISSAIWDDAARWRQSLLRLLATSC